MPPPLDADPGFLALQEALAGRYSIERELGRGGMGIVYLARDVALDRPVALKLLPPRFAAEPAHRDRFLREARTAARLSHPHVVPIHAVEEVGDFVFFVMSFVEGETLAQRIRGRGPLHPRDASRVLREVSWALAYAHAQGVVHRDVKPDNILLEAGSGRALVTDFGIARAGEPDGSSASGEVMGTPEYMSPEQASGGVVDGRSDLYALGVVGHLMLTGRLPFEGESPRATLARHLTEPAPPLATVAPEVPRALAEAVDRCLAKDPARRPQGGEELADMLGRVLSERREIPVAIRVFQDQNRDSTSTIVAVTMLVLMLVTVGWIIAALGEMEEGMPLFFLVFGSMWALVPLGMLGAMARRLLRSGYGYDELVAALASDVEERRRELASAVGGEGAVDLWAPRVAMGGLVVLVLSVLAILIPSLPVALLEPLLTAGYVLGLGGGLVAAVRHALRRAVPGERWLDFWKSPFGRGLFGLAALGAGDAGGGGGGAFRPTELALGMAAEKLFEELPRDVRKSLGDVPAVVKALERHAETMRVRIKELDEVIEEAPDDPDRTRRSTPVEERRGAVLDEVRRAREGAEGRLREVVAALESIRLELLRLHAGSGTVANLTADLGAARALSGDIRLLIEGRGEVDALLGRAAAALTPDATPPETPLPA